MGGCHLWEVSLIAIWLTEEPIGILVRKSLRDGRLKEVVTQRSSTDYYQQIREVMNCEQHNKVVLHVGVGGITPDMFRKENLEK